MLRKILIGVAAVIALLVIFIATRPAEFTVTRSAAMSAPPAAVFAQLNDFHKWDAWSPWAKMDPDSKSTFEGPASGEGAKFAWDGNSDVGAGNMTITESVPNDHVRIRLEFIRPFAGVSDTLFTIKPAGDKTNVTWTMSGKNNFIGKAISVVFDCDKMVGPQFEQGLANMEAIAIAESSSNNAPASAADTEIVGERLLDASPEVVFEAYRDPERLARWWGPKGFRSTFHEFDFRPGGKWRFDLHGPDGTNYKNESVFIEIDRPNRIVLDHLEPVHSFRMTMTMTPVDGKTRLNWRVKFESAAERDRVKQAFAEANEQNFDRLAAELSTMTANKSSSGGN